MPPYDLPNSTAGPYTQGLIQRMRDLKLTRNRRVSEVSITWNENASGYTAVGYISSPVRNDYTSAQTGSGRTVNSALEFLFDHIQTRFGGPEGDTH